MPDNVIVSLELPRDLVEQVDGLQRRITEHHKDCTECTHLEITIVRRYGLSEEALGCKRPLDAGELPPPAIIHGDVRRRDGSRMIRLRINEVNPAHIRLSMFLNGGHAGDLCIRVEELPELVDAWEGGWTIKDRGALAQLQALRESAGDDRAALVDTLIDNAEEVA